MMGMRCPLRLALGLWCLGLLPAVDGAVAILGSPVVDFTLVAVCIAAIVAFTIAFEIGLGNLERKLESYPLYDEMLQHVIKEVMILGLISFSLFMLEQFEVVNLSDEAQKKWVIGFEFSHILIFYMAVFFIAKSAVVVRVCSFSSRQWSRLQHETFEQTLDRFAPRCDTCDISSPRVVQPPGICTVLSGSCTRVMASHGDPAKQDMIWQLMALEFNMRVRMTHPDFDFARYMRVALRKTVAHAMHITWQIWFVCAVTLVTLFAAWGHVMGCEEGTSFRYRRQLGGADDLSAEVLYQCAEPELATNTSCRRMLGAAGPKPKLDPDSAYTATVCFCIFGWVLTSIQYFIAWRMEVHEEMHHFEALGLTETDESETKKKLEGKELLDRAIACHKELKSKLKILADRVDDDDSNEYTMPENTATMKLPTVMIWVGGLPCGTPEDLPQLEQDVRDSIEAVLGPNQVLDVRIRVKPPASELKLTPLQLEPEGAVGERPRLKTAQLRVSSQSVRDVTAGTKKVRSWGIVTIYGDTGQLKKAKADSAMRAKGWKFSTVDRTKLRSLQAKLFLSQADNVADNNMGSSAELVESSDKHEASGHAYDDADQSDHDHDHGHDHGHGHGHGGFTIQTAIDSLILLSCFYLALYTLFMYYAINAWSDWGTWTRTWMNILVIAPALINLGWIGPAALKAAAVVHGLSDIDEDAIKSVLEKMNTTIEAKAQLRDALRHEYGVDQPHPERDIWRDRYMDDRGALTEPDQESVSFGTWFKAHEPSATFFNKVAEAKTEAELKDLMKADGREKHVRLDKDDDGVYFKYYPNIPCPSTETTGTDSRFIEAHLDGMRDVLIADETARLILRTDFGLGEHGLVHASKGAIKAAGGKSSDKLEACKVTGQICRRDALRRFYNGERLHLEEQGRQRRWKMSGAACKRLSEREFNWVMRSVDPDQSGDLSRYELTLLVLGTERSLHDQKKQHQRQLRNQAGAALARQASHSKGMSVDERVADYRRIFHQADADKSGEVSASELQVVLQRVTGTQYSEEEVKEMIQAIDEDGSGDIDFGEFLMLMAESLNDRELANAAATECSKLNRTRQLWKKALDHVDGQIQHRSVQAEAPNAADVTDLEAGQQSPAKQEIPERVPAAP